MTDLNAKLDAARAALEALTNDTGVQALNLQVIAEAELAVQTAYDDAHTMIMAAVERDLERLNKEMAPLVGEAESLSTAAQNYLREVVLYTEKSFKLGDWLAVSYVKPTVALVSKDKMMGYVVAHPEAQELLKDVPARTRVARWRLDLLDV